MAGKKLKTYHHGGLRGALVAAGRAILEEEGAAALTLRACARRAGVSHAAPQHHFESAADLLAEIAASGFEDFVEALGMDAGPGPMVRLQSMGRAYVAFAEANPAIYQLMFGPRPPLASPRLHEAMVAAWAQLFTCVTAVVGESRANAAAVQVWSAVHGFAMLGIARCLPPHVDRAAALDAMIAGLPRAVVAPA